MSVYLKSVVIVGTAAYLHQQASKTSKNKYSERLVNTVLQASYLCYLAGAVRTVAKIEAPRFASFQRAMFIMTPVLMGAACCLRDKVVPLPKIFTDALYFFSVISRVAIRYFDSAQETLVTLAMYGVSYISQRNSSVKALVDLTTAVCATLAYLSFASWVMDSSDTALKVSTVATGVIILAQKLPKLPNLSSGSGGSSSYSGSYSSGRYYGGGYIPTSPYPTYSGSSSSSGSGSSFFKSLSERPHCL